MKSTLPQLPTADTNALAQSMNMLNARRTDQAEDAAGFVVAIVAAILAACALVHFATPCEAGHLCAAAVITPTRTGWWARLRNWLRIRSLRWRLADLNATLAHVEADLNDLPTLRMALRRERNALTQRLAAIEPACLEG